MFSLLLTCAALSLLFHAVFLLISFANGTFHPRCYSIAMIFLWGCGAAVFLTTLFYAGTHRSPFLDFFDTPVKKTAILMATLSISLIVHGIVRFLIVPDLVARYASEGSLEAL